MPVSFRLAIAFSHPASSLAAGGLTSASSELNVLEVSLSDAPSSNFKRILVTFAYVYVKCDVKKIPSGGHLVGKTFSRKLES
ncbi:hypothetical protein Ancab_034916 [Ancistrocladus abbreviatus]